MSLENPVPNGPTPVHHCQECQLFDRFRVPAVAQVTGQCACMTRTIDVCSRHLEDTAGLGVRCERCDNDVDFETVVMYV